VREELIVVDAKLMDVIDNKAFRAQLSNGHGLVAFQRAGEHVKTLHTGQTVRVRMSPYDMSVGELVPDTDGLHHEGT
jgi:translation initiation factor IF-1